MKIKIKCPENIDEKQTIGEAKAQKVVDFLEVNPLFEREVLRIRRKFSFPLNGFNFSNQKKDVEKLKLTDNSEFIREYQLLTKNANLALSWFDSVREFILYNIMFIPSKYPVKIMQYRAAELNYFIPSILITEHISKAKFFSYIKDNWNTIEQKLILLPKSKIHNMDEDTVKYGKKIVELRDKNISYRGILEILEREYPEDKKLLFFTESNLSKIDERWRNKTKSS
ncbi:MAG: hypothetical protein NTZ55_04450 [Candidatus Roizmanbacteria bacterium]|nr:hypothetical protein [Candidatus Roizmanbacteria bacterium]